VTPQHNAAPTFLDPTGRRWARLRAGALVAGVISTVLFLFVVTGVLIPPLLPTLPLIQTAADSLGHAPRAARTVAKHPISVRAERERLATRKRLFEYLKEHPAPPALRYAQMPIVRAASSKPSAPAGAPITAGFYVNWDDNSLASLRSHIDALDWVVAEWGFVGGGGGVDSVPIRLQVDRRVLVYAAHAKEPVRVFALITNFTGDDFDARALTRLLGRPRLVRRAISTIADTLARYDLAGVTLDFENVPRAAHPALLRFVRALKTRLARNHRLVTQAVPGDDLEWPLERYAAIDDYLFLMLYDEHDPSDEPGPIASDPWFEHHLERVLARVPAAKLIVGLGQYGYEWSDTTESATELTFQDVMQLARDHRRTPAMDRPTLNPTFAWDDPDSTSHVVWYLDGVTAYNELRRVLPRAVRGVAVWRLGSEDPSLWSVLDRSGLHANPALLDTIRIGYDVEFIGTGEILRMIAQPTLGQRIVRVIPSGEIVVDSVLRTPSTYVIQRYGRKKHAVALTFDDGPDPKWTPSILDTLASRDVTATFFIIGENAEVHPELLRRELRDGHEIGNHTFTHPNLALVGPRLTRYELSATERLIEAITNRRTALFRPPYFGDAEPTTSNELGPIAIAQDLGYVTVGLRDDPGDWLQPGVDTIIHQSLAQLDRGNVILLHDGGGNRAQTVAALGPLIDSLKARGYQLTTVTALAGLTRDQAMAPLPRSSSLRRFVELTSFSLVGWVELALRALFLVAMVLGIGRLVVLLALALRERRLRVFARRAVDTIYHPSVSVVVPAYNEERVIVRTVQSILAQDYAGLEIIVVDDGSPDHTADVVAAAFSDNPAVRIIRKPNGGKASALNVGVPEARGEIVVAVDADTMLAPGAIEALILPFADDRVGAVAGNAKVGNRINLVTRWQAVEYVTSQNLDRRAFALLNCITVVPGAIGGWRRALVLEAGGFSEQTLAEDQDLTLTLLRRGSHVAYADQAIAYTEAPDTFRGLARQRFRWSFGTLQCAWKHRTALFRRGNGNGAALGFVALPNVWVFQLLFPFLAPVADLMFAWSLVTVYLNKLQHGTEYAMQSLELVVGYYLAFLAVDWLAGISALLMEKGEERGLAWLLLLQRFVYRQVLYWSVVRAVVAAAQGRARGWGKLVRKGTVELPRAA
jgi:peptidoglycan-N-acetylglucosamine deacetylase